MLEGRSVADGRGPRAEAWKSFCLALALGIVFATAAPRRAHAEEEGGGVLTAVLIGAAVGGVVGLVFALLQDDDPQSSQAPAAVLAADQPAPWLAPDPAATKQAKAMPDALRVHF